jgi:hypothetical protein
MGHGLVDSLTYKAGTVRDTGHALTLRDNHYPCRQHTMGGRGTGRNKIFTTTHHRGIVHIIHYLIVLHPHEGIEQYEGQ